MIPKHCRHRTWKHLLKRPQALDLEGFVTVAVVLPAAPVCALETDGGKVPVLVRFDFMGLGCG